MRSSQANNKGIVRAWWLSEAVQVGLHVANLFVRQLLPKFKRVKTCSHEIFEFGVDADVGSPLS